MRPFKTDGLFVISRKKESTVPLVGLVGGLCYVGTLGEGPGQVRTGATGASGGRQGQLTAPPILPPKDTLRPHDRHRG